MEEKPEAPSPDSVPGIHSILKSMLQENKSPLSEKTALSNLKNVLSKADEAARNTPDTITRSMELVSPPAPALNILEAPKKNPQASTIFESDPVKELDALIKAYRAKR